jgi:hypothetical protein
VSAKEIKEFLKTIGAKGGSAKGPSKRRGDSNYYRALAARRGKGATDEDTRQPDPAAKEDR